MSSRMSSRRLRTLPIAYPAEDSLEARPVRGGAAEVGAAPSIVSPDHKAKCWHIVVVHQLRGPRCRMIFVWAGCVLPASQSSRAGR